MSEKIKGWLRESLGHAAILLLVAAYVGSALLTMSETGKTVGEIVRESFTYMLFCISIDHLFTLQGLMNGERDPLMAATKAEHAKAVDAIKEHINYLDSWCVIKTREALKNARERRLMSEGMSYTDYFDAQGRALGYRAPAMPPELYPKPGEPWQIAVQRRERRRVFEHEERRRQRAYRAAVRMSVTPLLSGALTGLVARRDDPYHFSASNAKYESEQVWRSAVWYVAVALLLGYYGVELIDNFAYQLLLLRALQVALALGRGVMRQRRACLFVTEKKRDELIHKIDILEMFKAYMEYKKAEKGGDLK